MTDWLDMLDKTKKTSLDHLNPLGSIEEFVTRTIPELIRVKDLWLTGGQVWRRVYNYEVFDIKDIDLFTTTPEANRQVLSFLYGLESCRAMDGSTSFGGTKFYTSRGIFDLWEAKSAKATLKAYTESKKFARMAYNISGRYMIQLANEQEPNSKAT